MALVSELDGIIFDYGGVLVHHQSEADHARMARLMKAEPEKFSEAYWSDRTHYDQGSVTNVEYWMDVAAKAGTGLLTEKQIEDLTEEDTVSWMRYDEEMWRWIDELRRAGKKLAMLSNMPMELGQALKTRSDRLDRFDHVTLSYEVRAVKPGPQIYEECLDGIGTEAARTLFLDDRIENVRGAEFLGIRAMQFSDRDDVLLRVRG